MRRLRLLILCLVLAVSLGYGGHIDAWAAGASDESGFTGEATASLSDRAVVIVSDAVSCVVPLYQTARFSVRAEGQQLRYQWQICDPGTNLWTDISDISDIAGQYFSECRGATEPTLSFRADVCPRHALRFRCAVTDGYGNTAVGSPVFLRVTYGNAPEINAAAFGADGTDGKDDSAAIQAAFDFAEEYADEEKPVTVRLSDGQYHIAHMLYIPSHVRFILSAEAELNDCGDNGCMLQSGAGRRNEGNTADETLTDVTICGGRWNANASAGDGPTAPIVIVKARDIRLRDLDMRQSSCHAVMLAGVEDVEVTGCTFHDAMTTGKESPDSREAVAVGYIEKKEYRMSRNVTVRDCVFDSVHGGVGVRYIDEENSTSRVTVQNCVFRHLPGSCVNAFGVRGLTVKDCRASDCGTFLNAFGTGGDVVGNVMEGMGARGLSLTGGSVVNVTDNRISQVGKRSSSVRMYSKGLPEECGVLPTEAERQIIDAVYKRIEAPTASDEPEPTGRQVYPVNARTIRPTETDDSASDVVAVYYSDSMGSVTGNTVTDVQGRGVFVENSPSLTVISDNVFRGVKDTDVHTSGSRAAVMRNRFDRPDKSVVMDRFSDDGIKRDGYNQNESPATEGVVVMLSEDVMASVNDVIGFSVAAQGNGLSYQWYYRPDGSCFWSVWEGQTAAAAEAGASCFWDRRQVCCVITDRDGRRTATQPIRVTLRPRMTLTTQPRNETPEIGDEVSFSVNTYAFGDRFQWYYRLKNDLLWTKWETQTQNSLSVRLTEEWDGAQVYGRVSNVYKRTVRSTSVAAVSVVPSTGFFSQPESVTADNGASVSFSVKTYGDGLQHQWYCKSSHDDVGKLLTGENDAEWRTTAYMSRNGSEVYCVVSDAFGKSVLSQSATLTVKGARSVKEILSVFDRFNRAPKLVSLTGDVIVREGEGATVSAAVSGSDCRWQWYCQKTPAAMWIRLNGYDTPSVDLPSEALCDGMRVRCEARDKAGRLTVSEPVRIRVISAPVIVRQPKDVNVKPGEKAVFSVEAFGTELRYQWYYRLPGDSQWTQWQNRTASSFEETAALWWNGMQVCCTVTDGSGRQATSVAAYVAAGNVRSSPDRPKVSLYLRAPA